MSGFGVVIRVKTEDQAKELVRKIVDLTDEAGMNPRPVDIYKFETEPIPGITCKRGHYYIVG